MISFSKKNRHNIYNIGSGKGVKIADIWMIIKNITKSRLEANLVPKRAFDISRYVLDTERFRQEYCWMPKIELSEGLQRVWNWILSLKK